MLDSMKVRSNGRVASYFAKRGGVMTKNIIQLSEVPVDELFLGTHAEDFEHGLIDSAIEFSEVKRPILLK